MPRYYTALETNQERERERERDRVRALGRSLEIRPSPVISHLPFPLLLKERELAYNTLDKINHHHHHCCYYRERRILGKFWKQCALLYAHAQKRARLCRQSNAFKTHRTGCSMSAGRSVQRPLEDTRARGLRFSLCEIV